jgi:hypothetical protein
LRLAFEGVTGLRLERFFDRWIYDATIPTLQYTAIIADGSVTVRFEQTGDIFDVPVTVSVMYSDGRVQNVVVPVTDSRVERTIPTTGLVRQVQVNRDYAAIAEFDQM